MYKIIDKRHGMLVLERDGHTLKIEEKGCYELVTFSDLSMKQ